MNAGEILKARARILAKPLSRPEAAENMLEVVEFRLAQERYAIGQADLREIYPLKDLTPLPGTPPFLLGVINVRGQIVSVIDLRKFFELPDNGITDLHMVMILQSEEMAVGILADSVIGVRSIRQDDLQTSLPTLTGVRAKYLKGVTAEHIAVLNVAEILADPKIIVNDDTET